MLMMDPLTTVMLTLRGLYPAARQGICVEYAQARTSMAALLRSMGLPWRRSADLARDAAALLGEPGMVEYVAWLERGELGGVAAEPFRLVDSEDDPAARGMGLDLPSQGERRLELRSHPDPGGDLLGPFARNRAVDFSQSSRRRRRRLWRRRGRGGR
jgi:hypothetical protein